MVRYDNRVLNWVDEDNEINTRNDNQESFRDPGGDFWRSVWKRIESSSSPGEWSTQLRDMSPEPPRDYVVETDNHSQARPGLPDRSRG